MLKELSNYYEIKNIALTGGEPTTRKDIYEISKMISKYSPYRSITTNGFALQTEEQVDKIITCGINRFSFSYHGINQHDEFTGVVGAEKKILNAINLLINAKNKYSDIFIKIGSLFNGNNIQQIEKMLEFCEEKQILLYIELIDYYIPIFKDSELAKKYLLKQLDLESLNKTIKILNSWLEQKRALLLSNEGVKFIKNYFENKNIKGSCPLGKTDLYISSEGDVYTGCWSLPSVGNIRKKSIMDIINSDKFKNNIQKMLCRDCGGGCTCGYLMQAKYCLFNK